MLAPAPAALCPGMPGALLAGALAPLLASGPRTQHKQQLSVSLLWLVPSSQLFLQLLPGTGFE